MQCLNFEEAVAKIVEADPRYPFGAYLFIQDVLEYTQKMLGRSVKGQQHVAGKELVEGLRGYASEKFGPMAITVLEEWNIRSCQDVGEIVFNLIAHNLASKTDSDSREDFKNGFDFFEAFSKPFLPTASLRAEQRKSVEV
jgi:uncharacterized repeat protein (TIGR04138 family)